MKKYFGFEEKNTSYKDEISGGVVSFLSMSYIIFVNPLVLSATGMDQMAVFAATALGAAIATIFMGVYAKFPLGLAPCMSMNAFFAYTVCLGMGFTWEAALSCVLLSSILFIIISISGYRQKVQEAIPSDLKYASSVGLGLFICFIGMKNAGLIVPDENLMIAFGSFKDPNVIIALAGIIAFFIMLVRNSKFIILKAMFVSIITSYILKIINYFGLINITDEVYATLPHIDMSEGLFINPFVPLQAMFDYTFGVAITHIPEVLTISGIGVIITFCFLDFFGTSATLSAANAQIEQIDSSITPTKKIFIVDAVGTFIGSILGTSNITTYIESVSGIVSGGRTGLVSVVCGILFIMSLCLYPLLGLFTSSVTAPALVAIGVFMFKSIKNINFDEGFEVIIPVFLTIILMPLSGSIILALTIGFVMYVLLMLVVKRRDEIHKYMYIIAVLSSVYLISLI